MLTEDEEHEQDLAQNKQRKDKASSRKRQRENGSQTDEESGGRHCCEASANLLEPDYMSQAGPVSRDLGMPVKRNKNQLCDYMTTGPVSRCRDPG